MSGIMVVSMRMAQQDHVFECLAPSCQYYLGRIRRCGLSGGGMPFNVALRFKKAYTICSQLSFSVFYLWIRCWILATAPVPCLFVCCHGLHYDDHGHSASGIISLSKIFFTKNAYFLIFNIKYITVTYSYLTGQQNISPTYYLIMT